MAQSSALEFPQKFTYDFLKQLGFPSSGDRPIIAVLKALRFLDDGSVPLERYRRFRDSAQAKSVMAEAVRDAYGDAFTVNESANTLSVQELRGLFARLTGKSESVTEKMAITFKALADRADFDAPPRTDDDAHAADLTTNGHERESTTEEPKRLTPLVHGFHLRHDIHLHLPESREIAVYDAIFRALRQNLGE